MIFDGGHLEHVELSRIFDDLWIGDMVDGQSAKPTQAVLCVMWPGEPGQSHPCHRIVTTEPLADGRSVRVVPSRMDEAARWIFEQRQAGRSVLVHCAFGVERSPLTVVWYLMRKHQLTLQEAYDVVCWCRPVAARRLHWLPASVRETGRLPPDDGGNV